MDTRPSYVWNLYGTFSEKTQKHVPLSQLPAETEASNFTVPIATRIKKVYAHPGCWLTSWEDGVFGVSKPKHRLGISLEPIRDDWFLQRLEVLPASLRLEHRAVYPATMGVVFVLFEGFRRRSGWDEAYIYIYHWLSCSISFYRTLVVATPTEKQNNDDDDNDDGPPIVQAYPGLHLKVQQRKQNQLMVCSPDPG